MNTQYPCQFKWALPALLMILAVSGCSGRNNLPSNSAPLSALPSPTLVEIVPSPINEKPALSPTTAPTLALPSTDASDLPYRDDFSDSGSGWLVEEAYDNYFIGYHPIETLYYHVEIQSPTAKALVPVPEKQKYGDITAEAVVFANASNTAPEGDFRYGLAFRRTGENYYAFAVSPRSGKWVVLKSSPESVDTLKEGTDDSIQGLAPGDRLRVDAKGSTFFLHINDQLVGQVSDDGYAEGEVTLYAETRDAAYVHVHVDSVTLREVEAPQLVCNVTSIALRVRSGPSTTFDPIEFLAHEARIEPQGRSLNGNWLRVWIEGSNIPGWIFYHPNWLSCNFAISDLPVIEP